MTKFVMPSPDYAAAAMGLGTFTVTVNNNPKYGTPVNSFQKVTVGAREPKSGNRYEATALIQKDSDADRYARCLDTLKRTVIAEILADRITQP